MPPRPRVLVFDGPQSTAEDPLASCAEGLDLVRVHNLAQGLARMQSESFAGIFASAADPRVWQRVLSLLQTDAILEVLGEGVAVVGTDLRILWANSTFEKWCGDSVKGRNFYEALGSPQILGPEFAPFYLAPAVKPVNTILHRTDHQFLELRVATVMDRAGKVQQWIAMCRDATTEVQKQKKLDALHSAGRALANLQADHLAEMSVEERVELLKHNIRRLTHELLQYDVIEIRMLDQATGKLEPLLAEGLTPVAAPRVLYAKEEGNGVTGYVAATGKSYVCNDTTCDPHYIEGAVGARSSLTVALTWENKVIGTFNVESPQQGGFGPEDVQFAEIFCRELAWALNTLELLRVEQRATASKSIEAVNREVALPVDDILTAATSLLERWIGHEPEMAEKLKTILASARSVKQSIQKVGEALVGQTVPLAVPEPAAPPSKFKGQRVLVVDHDERVRRSAHTILGRLGCIVETARDGQQALTMARLGAYDVMLADIHLPDLSGYDVFRALRDAQPQARVILMTGYGYDPAHSIVKARQEGLGHVLYKPFRVEQLLDALQNIEPAAASAPVLQTLRF